MKTIAEMRAWYDAQSEAWRGTMFGREYGALLAVAEAAQDACYWLGRPETSLTISDLKPLRDALAALAEPDANGD